MNPNLNLHKKQAKVIGGLLVLIIATIIAGMGIGYSSLSFSRLLPTLFGQGTFAEDFVLFSVRLPRIIICLLSGMALALSGAILQGVTRNDLADPGIVGINSGAGVAISVFFLFFSTEVGSLAYVLPFAAFLGGLAAATLIYWLAYRRSAGLQPVRLVLTGVGFSMALSGVMIVIISSADRQKVDFISKWLAGNIWGADWPFIWALLPWLLVLLPFTLYKAGQLNLLNLDEPVSISVGVPVERERILLLIAAVALASSAVAVTGGIAFIGLMAPHIARALVGPRNQLSIPVAVLSGGWLLVMADTIGRNLADPDGVPAGIMAALIGAPYFMYLLIKKR
ncbi:iron ABC transporter permease [Paenibacillus sp. J22TS3]|uniref:FecCD family ABC transporter permease n=1 Tax=Paenibacillus sp. J22TS3 TaxID=2807192 RepID=UPI001B1595A1|nr:iron ABC transporter permease [Paenibacillus sp. J22TS3]GIP23784.1 iron ABC transporter permease [Paenibacillus sp. J22TS3]